nr:DUF2345 domain-containing protein [Xenorhabdus szentirmaii]
MALTSDSHVQLAAGDNLMVNVGGHANIGVMENMTLQVGHSLGVFAQQSGIQLKANGGKVDVQAQNNALSLLAKGKISLTAVDGDVLFAAKKRFKINAGGSYLILQDGKIEYGTSHDYVRKTVHSVKTKSAPQNLPMPYLPGDGRYDLSLDFRDDDNEPIAQALYKITFDNGAVLSGQLDEQGYALHKNVPLESAVVEYILPDPQPDPPWKRYDVLLSEVDAAFSNAQGVSEK